MVPPRRRPRRIWGVGRCCRESSVLQHLCWAAVLMAAFCIPTRGLKERRLPLSDPATLEKWEGEASHPIFHKLRRHTVFAPALSESLHTCICSCTCASSHPCICPESAPVPAHPLVPVPALALDPVPAQHMYLYLHSFFHLHLRLHLHLLLHSSSFYRKVELRLGLCFALACSCTFFRVHWQLIFQSQLYLLLDLPVSA